MDTLVVMAKHPVAGQVKTRLAASLGEEPAAALATAFLEDLVRRLADCGDRRILATWPQTGEAQDFFTQQSAGRFDLWPQPEGSLGDRLQAAFGAHLRPGLNDRVVVIGSDSPTLPTQTLAAAFDALDQKDVVLGPATDGGYVLIGLRRMVPGLFEQIDWSTAVVYEQTLQRLDAAGVRPAVLPAWYDIDTLDDLDRLYRELDDGAGQSRIAPATWYRLRELSPDWDTRPTGG
ncbi:MAG: TIGR04282 family arsenosugar biosynthesis glycosyltransferase [Planctomycetaceae bacterium]